MKWILQNAIWIRTKKLWKLKYEKPKMGEFIEDNDKEIELKDIGNGF